MVSFFLNLVEAVAALGNKVVESLRAQDPSEGLRLLLVMYLVVIRSQVYNYKYIKKNFFFF